MASGVGKAYAFGSGGAFRLVWGVAWVNIEISKQMRVEAIASIQRYFEENLPEPIGKLPAGLLLDFFLAEVGPAVYNRAIADAQERLGQRLMDLPGELYVEPLQYWPTQEKKRKSRG